MVLNPRSSRWMFTHQLADWHNHWKGVYAATDGAHCRPRQLQQAQQQPHQPQAPLQGRAPGPAPGAHLGDASPSGGDEKCREIRRSPAFRSRMSDRMKEAATREVLSAQAQAQWSDPAYKRFMVERWGAFYAENAEYRAEVHAQLDRAQREYWSDEGHRRAQGERVHAHFEAHPNGRGSCPRARTPNGRTPTSGRGGARRRPPSGPTGFARSERRPSRRPTSARP